MSKPPTSDSGVQVEEAGLVVAGEVTINEDIRRGFDGEADKDGRNEMNSESNSSFTNPEVKAREDVMAPTQPGPIDRAIPRSDSRASSDRFSQTTDGFENLIRDSHGGLFSIVRRQEPSSKLSWYETDNSIFGVSNFSRQNNDEAQQLAGGRFGDVASRKNGVGPHSAMYERIFGNRLTFAGNTGYTQLDSRKGLSIQPVGHLAHEKLSHRNLAYVRHEVYPPWRAGIPGQRDTAKAVLEPAPYVKAFSDHETPQTNNSSRVGRCVICKGPLPYDYNGDTCCQCGGKVCKKCIERERIHWH